MTSFRSLATAAAGLSVVLMSVFPAVSQELGTIAFPTSGAAAAQEAFLTGVKALHSFQFDEAAVAFQQAQKADPSFAMAYWGEAMSHNHPSGRSRTSEAAKQSSTGSIRRTRAVWQRRSCRRKKRSSRRCTSSISRRATSSRATPPTRRPWRAWPRSGRTTTRSPSSTRLSLLGTVRPATRASGVRRSPPRSRRVCFKRTRSIRAPRISSSTPSTTPTTRRWV